MFSITCLKQEETLKGLFVKNLKTQHTKKGQNNNIMRKISLQYMVWKWFIYMYIITWIRVSTNIICCPTIWVGRNVTLLLTFIAAGTTVLRHETLPHPRQSGSRLKFVSIVEMTSHKSSWQRIRSKTWKCVYEELAWVATTTSALSPLPSQQEETEDIGTNKLTIVVCALWTKTANPSTVQRARTFWQKK